MSQINNKKETLIPLKSVLYITQVSPRQFYLWEVNGKIKPILNSKGIKCLTLNDFRELAHSSEVKEAALQGMVAETERRLYDKEQKKNNIFLNQVKIKIKNYHNYIRELEKIHRKYNSRLDIRNSETPVVAAYLLYSRVISLLKMTNYCFKNKFVEGYILFRPIDEAIQLAQYFIISANTNEGKKHLKEWFRENKSPSNSICRKSIAKYMHNFSKIDSDEYFEESLVELYQGKSKPVHHSYNVIKECYKTKFDAKNALKIEFDYGRCSYPRKLIEHVEFFQSSIWSAMQGFTSCFHESLPMDIEDINLLYSYDLKFKSEMYQRRSKSGW
jgi:hypothetical protein